MRKGLRKVVISSAALILLIALIAPALSASSAFADTTNISGSSWGSMTPPTTNPVETIEDPITDPDKMETPPSSSEEEGPDSQPAEIESEISVVDEDPGDPDISESPIVKVRGKSNPNGYGSGGKFKKSK
jgi:hypothetical protein